MNHSTADRALRVAEVFDLPEPEEQLYILFDPNACEAWGWGFSEDVARAAALRRLRELDAELPPFAGEEPPERYLQRCELMRVSVAHRHALDLLGLLDLNSPGELPESVA